MWDRFYHILWLFRIHRFGGASWDIPRLDWICNPSSSALGSPLKGGVVLIRCLYHLIWVLLMQRSSSGTLGSFRISHLVWLSPDNPKKKKIQSNIFQILLFCSLPKAHDWRWGMKPWSRGNLSFIPRLSWVSTTNSLIKCLNNFSSPSHA